MILRKTFFLFVLFCGVIPCKAQLASNRFAAVDAYIKKIGSLDSLNMGTISDLITKNFSDNESKVRAIFDWVAMYINYDLKSGRNNENPDVTSDEILRSHKATSLGYASLFQDLCSAANIRCLVIEGYLKRNEEDINNIPDGFNHAWNVVQLGQSSDAWYYVDVALASGYTDNNFKFFTKSFNDNYFFADRNTFNLQHLPGNLIWQFGSHPAKSTKDFFAQAVLKNAAYEYGITGFIPITGILKITAGKIIPFSIETNPQLNVSVVELIFGDEKKKKSKQVNFTFNSGHLNFNYKFEDESAPMAISINGKEVIQYTLDAE